jgi:UDP-N-acetyl-D-glucosamine dehydrogenase
MDEQNSRAASEVDVAALAQRFRNRDATIGVIGLGYVGLPLIKTLNRRGFRTIGFDVDVEKVSMLEAGESYIHHIPAEEIQTINASGLFRATTEFSAASEADAILICVPTPLNRYREPDMSYVVSTTESIAPFCRVGQLVVLESTTYPGTTTEVMRPILERPDLTSGVNFFMGYSPEREDPGNANFDTATIPKVVGGDGPAALDLITVLYEEIVSSVVPVSTTATAEAVKLTENIFRSVNIALVNELKIVYEKMGIDIWEVIDAAKTKPFGFMPFYPGPGLGGHCIPIDPFYLTWKAREFNISTRFIELAGQINTAMPEHVVLRLVETLDRRFSKGLNGSKILIMGMAYKKNVDDMRESPSLVLTEMLAARGASVDYYDPFVPQVTPTREHPELSGMASIVLSPDTIATYDAVLISTDHDDVDYDMLVANAKVVVDTRNATKSVTAHRDKIVKA